VADVLGDDLTAGASLKWSGDSEVGDAAHRIDNLSK
jgi:hypothetical protein